MTFNEAKALPLLWTSRKFGNRFVGADAEKELKEAQKRFPRNAHTLLVQVQEWPDLGVYQYEIHG
jgi:hypothetical protein